MNEQIHRRTVRYKKKYKEPFDEYLESKGLKFNGWLELMMRKVLKNNK